MTTKQIQPARSVSGAVMVPGDKSISHRYGMLASIAEGASKIANYSTGADCQSTLRCMQALGVPMEQQDGILLIHGQGLNGLRPPAGPLDAAKIPDNSLIVEPELPASSGCGEERQRPNPRPSTVTVRSSPWRISTPSRRRQDSVDWQSAPGA